MQFKKRFLKPFSKSVVYSSLFISGASIAIDETESLRKKAQDKPSFRLVSFDLSGKSGNSEKNDYSLGLFQSMRQDNHFAFYMATVDYAESNDVKSEDSAFFHGRYNYYYEPTAAIEFFAQVNKDEFKSLESRKLVGISYRKEFSDLNTVGIGFFDETEEYKVNDTNLNFNQTRLSAYWVYSYDFTSGASLSNTLYYQPNAESFSDYRVYNNFNLKSKVTDKLSLKFGMLIEHDSNPVLNVEKTDIKYQAGFTYQF